MSGCSPATTARVLLRLFRRHATWCLAVALFVPVAMVLLRVESLWAHRQPLAMVVLVSLYSRPRSQRALALSFIRTSAALGASLLVFLLVTDLLGLDRHDLLYCRGFGVLPTILAFMVVASAVLAPALNRDEWSKRLVFGASLAWTGMVFEKTTYWSNYGSVPGDYFTQFSIDVAAQGVASLRLAAVSALMAALVLWAVGVAYHYERARPRKPQPHLLLVGAFGIWLLSQAGVGWCEYKALCHRWPTLGAPFGGALDTFARLSGALSVLGVVVWLGVWLSLSMRRSLHSRRPRFSFWPLALVLLLHLSTVMSPVPIRRYAETPGARAPGGSEVVASTRSSDYGPISGEGDHLALRANGALQIRSGKRDWRLLLGVFEPSLQGDHPRTVTLWLEPDTHMVSLRRLTPHLREFRWVRIVWRRVRRNEAAEKRWSWARADRHWLASEAIPLIDCAEEEQHDACTDSEPRNENGLRVSEWLNRGRSLALAIAPRELPNAPLGPAIRTRSAEDVPPISNAELLFCVALAMLSGWLVFAWSVVQHLLTVGRLWRTTRPTEGNGSEPTRRVPPWVPPKSARTRTLDLLSYRHVPRVIALASKRAAVLGLRHPLRRMAYGALRVVTISAVLVLLVFGALMAASPIREFFAKVFALLAG